MLSDFNSCVYGVGNQEASFTRSLAGESRGALT